MYTEGIISVGTNLHFGIQTFIHFGVLFVNGHLYVIMKEQCRLNGCLLLCWSWIFFLKEAMINNLCHELRVLSNCIEYFYQFVHRFQTMLQVYIISLHIIQPGTIQSIFLYGKYLLKFPKVINRWCLFANIGLTSKKKSLIGKG